jgi:hypothetical protein
MAVDGGLSVDNPGDEDPGIFDLIQSNTSCSQLIFYLWLENPLCKYQPAIPAHNSDLFISPDTPLCHCCHRCNPSIIPGRELCWVQVNPAPVAKEGALKPTPAEKEIIHSELVKWRLELWRTDWRDGWPAYGPKSLVSDVDIRNISNNAGSIHVEDDLLRYTNILHWDELLKPLFCAVREELVLVHGDMALNQLAMNAEVSVVNNTQSGPADFPQTRVTVGRLERDEVVMSF